MLRMYRSTEECCLRWATNADIPPPSMFMLNRCIVRGVRGATVRLNTLPLSLPVLSEPSGTLPPPPPRPTKLNRWKNIQPPKRAAVCTM